MLLRPRSSSSRHRHRLLLLMLLHLLLHLPLLYMLHLNLVLHRQLPLFIFQPLLHELHVGQMLWLWTRRRLLRRRECAPRCPSAGRSHAPVAEEVMRVRYRAGVLLTL